MSDIVSAGNVASKSEALRTGAIAAKFGTQPTMVRARPAAAAAAFTGFSTRVPTLTATCGQRDHALRPHRRNAGWPLRPKHRHVSAPIASAVTPSLVRPGAGAIATST